jgi:hypothetical protein
MNICKICQLSSPSGCTKLSNEVCLKDAPKLIRASTTNGDVIKAIFPHHDIEVNEQKNYVQVFYDSFYTTYPLRWWLEPYKAKNEDR